MSYDPYGTAMTDEPETIYGQVAIEAFKCVLIKGQGRVPFDANVHAKMRTSTAIEFTIAHVDPTMPLVERGSVNWGKDFKEVVRPSVEKLVPDLAALKGLTVGQFNPLKQLSGMWVCATLVEQPGDDRYTCLRFDALYTDEAACRLAYEASSGREVGGSPVADLPFEPEEPATKSSPEREALAAFLPSVWERSGHNAAIMEELLKRDRVLGAVFDIDSPEVVAVMK